MYSPSFLTIFSLATSLVPQEVPCDIPIYRLPETFKPTLYELNISPDLETFNFNGNTVIHWQAEESRPFLCHLSNAAKKCTDEDELWPRNKIVLNAGKDLQFQSISAQLSDGRELAIKEICRDVRNSLLQITFKKPIPEGKSGQLKFDYIGKIRDDMIGLYRSSYNDQYGEKHYYATTQFESASARLVFPSFDEPNFKAPIDLKLEYPPELSSLANTEPKEEKLVQRPDGSVATQITYERTPPMSTYLLAFVVGHFSTLSRDVTCLNDTVKIRVHAPPGQVRGGKFALDVAEKVITNLHDWFHVEQPMKKYDLVALDDFDAAAMENWGLITFKTEYLLVDKNTDPKQLRDVAITIVHELAHQWFGNLVTMKWWNDLWLNEGFAEWMSYELANKLFPELELRYTYIFSDHWNTIFSDDRGQNKSPIRSLNLETVEEIDAKFDDITYFKGAAVIRMLSEYIGKEDFRRAISVYIKQHQFGNADSSDLWSSVEKTTGIKVKALMISWLDQIGHPLVYVRYKSKTNSLSFLQNAMGTRDRSRWIIPIVMTVSDGKDRVETRRFLMDKNSYLKSHEEELPSWFDLKAGHWVKINSEMEGFYRVSYEEQLLDALCEPIQSKQLAPIDRLNILDDYTVLLGTKTKVERSHALAKCYMNEDNSAVIYVMATRFDKYKRYYYKDVKQWLSVFGNFYQKLGKKKVLSDVDMDAKVQVSNLLTNNNIIPYVVE